MAGWKQQTERFALALSFFSRLPMPAGLLPDDKPAPSLARAVAWFPIAGAVIALVPGLIYWLSVGPLPPWVGAGLAIAAAAWITGALHEDGLADCADGLGGGHTPQRALEIMRDSNIGAYGALALIFSVGIKWGALAALPPLTGFAALIITHSAARGSLATALAFSTYARPSGTGDVVAKGIDRTRWLLTLAIVAIIALTAGGLTGLLAAAIGIAAAAGFLFWFARRIGGYTGDGLGGMEQIAEIAILISLAAFWGISA